MNIPTADLCDQFPEQVYVIQRPLKSFGGRKYIAGEIVTLRIAGCNQGIIDCLQNDGGNRILVVENSGPEPNAITGDRIAQMAIDNNWQGLVIYGNIRDSETIAGMDIGIWALGTYPMRGKSGRPYEKNTQISMHDYNVRSGYYLYADADGIVISENELK